MSNGNEFKPEVKISGEEPTQAHPLKLKSASMILPLINPIDSLTCDSQGSVAVSMNLGPMDPASNAVQEGS